MIFRAAKQSDSEQVYECFRLASITEQDLVSRIMPKKGFYEYPLNFEDVAAKVDSQFSLVAEEAGRIKGYVLAYDLNHLPRLAAGHQDPIHNQINIFDGNVVYLDQLFIDTNYPITLVARLADTWEHMLQLESVPGVITAIPESP